MAVARLLARLSLGRSSRIARDWALRRAARRIKAPEIIWDTDPVVAGPTLAEAPVTEVEAAPEEADTKPFPEPAQAEAEAEKMHRGLRDVLSRAIEHGGTTLQDYRNADGRPGLFGTLLCVYGREEEPCVTCATPIERVVIGNRSAFLGPACQPPG